MNFFQLIGGAVIGPVQAAEDAATKAFYVLSGLELLILIGIVILIIQGWA
jgi:hypothetical protein